MNTRQRRRRRIWVQQVAVDSEKLRTRLKAARARGFDPAQEEIANGVNEQISRASNAAFRDDPIPSRWANWWRGTLVETAFRNLHTARAEIVDLVDPAEVRAEIPAAVARAQAALPRDDPRQASVVELKDEPIERLRPRLRRLIDDSYQALDGKHAQLRNFRNILLLTALFVTALVVCTLAFVAQNPNVMPLCFEREVVTETTTPIVKEVVGQNCPTRSNAAGPTGGDVLVVALIGALGGALATALSIRNLKGTSTPYDVPVAMAMLKVPLGAFTAMLAVVAIQGNFVPGLSVLDSQEQILAYALIFGFAQQLLTQFLDQRAQTLLEGLPGGTAAEPPPRVPPSPPPPTPPPPPTDGEQPASDGPAGGPPADLPHDDVEVISSEEPLVAPPEDEEAPPEAVPADEVSAPDPLTDQGDDLQDDPDDEASRDEPEGENRG